MERVGVFEIVRDKAFVALLPPLSFTLKVILAGPKVVVGVPLIMPVDGLSVRNVGRAPVVIDQVV